MREIAEPTSSAYQPNALLKTATGQPGSSSDPQRSLHSPDSQVAAVFEVFPLLIADLSACTGRGAHEAHLIPQSQGSGFHRVDRGQHDGRQQQWPFPSGQVGGACCSAENSVPGPGPSAQSDLPNAYLRDFLLRPRVGQLAGLAQKLVVNLLGRVTAGLVIPKVLQSAAGGPLVDEVRGGGECLVVTRTCTSSSNSNSGELTSPRRAGPRIDRGQR